MSKMLFLFLLSPLLGYSQTLVIITCRNDTVMIGADSKLGLYNTAYSKNGNIESKTATTICKIRQKGNVYYTGAGFGMDIITNYSKGIAINKRNPITIDFPFNKVVNRLQSYIDSSRRIHSIIYEHFKGPQFCTVAFVWFLGQNPRTQVIQFKLTNNDSEPIRVKYTVSRQDFILPKDMRATLPIGHTEAINNVVYSRDFWTGKNTNDCILKLIKMQIKATPSDVGEPIAVVQLTYNKTEWLECGVCCPRATIRRGQK